MVQAATNFFLFRPDSLYTSALHKSFTYLLTYLILGVSKPSISQRSQIKEDTVELSVPAREFNLKAYAAITWHNDRARLGLEPRLADHHSQAARTGTLPTAPPRQAFQRVQDTTKSVNVPELSQNLLPVVVGVVVVVDVVFSLSPVVGPVGTKRNQQQLYQSKFNLKNKSTCRTKIHSLLTVHELVVKTRI